EYAVELVEIALDLDECYAREIVEIVDAPAGEILLHGLNQGQVLAQRDRNARGLEVVKEGNEHRPSIARRKHAWPCSGPRATSMRAHIRHRAGRLGPTRPRAAPCRWQGTVRAPPSRRQPR